MYTRIEKQKENSSRAVANSVGQKRSSGEKKFSIIDNRKKNLNLSAFENNVIQEKINGSGRKVAENEYLKHGTQVKDFLLPDKITPKASNVPDGPGWFTAVGDYKDAGSDTPFNLHAAIRFLNDSGKLYLHRLQAAKELNLITFDNQLDAKNKLKSDGVNEANIPKWNNKNMAKLVKDHSENDGQDGYRYNEDLVRHEPEVIIHDTSNVKPFVVVEYDVSSWKNEVGFFSRIINHQTSGDQFKQKSPDKQKLGTLEKI